jgi:hypothetical protein
MGACGIAQDVNPWSQLWDHILIQVWGRPISYKEMVEVWLQTPGLFKNKSFVIAEIWTAWHITKSSNPRVDDQ